ncbi:MAG TPA: hypothetical protein VNM69_02285 [Bacillus sp. (in: firmicutes)]|nr:hypothetical protein [Bacillus sp. (in: firmicutes)]
MPSIIDVASQYGLTFNPKSLNKKEVTCKCPFCLADANRNDRHYLSLNQHDNVFKCWYCGEKGGVLVFESKLAGKPYDEIKKKYFGEKKKYHPAEMLSPQQLRKINWADVKRKQHEDFKRSLNQVLADWDAYQYEERRLAFAKLLVGIETFKYQIVIANIRLQAEQTNIPNLLDDVLKMYSSSKWDNWAIEGEYLAKTALSTAEQANDDNALLYVLFANRLRQDELDQPVLRSVL